MNETEIKDWQFGVISWNKEWKFYGAEVEWAPDLKIDLTIRVDGIEELNAHIESIRTIFNSVRKNEYDFRSHAAHDLIDTFNEIFESYDEDQREEGWPFDVRYLISRITLLGIEIYADGKSRLTYSTWGGPLIRVTVSPDLSFKEALFD